MDEAKRTYRDVEQKTKKAWRNSDGEDLADLAGNAGDEARKDIGNAADRIRQAGDEIRRPEDVKP